MFSCVFTWVFTWRPLKPMHLYTKYIIKALKSKQFAIEKQASADEIHKNLFKPMNLCTKYKQKTKTESLGYSQPGGPAIRTTTVYMRPRSLAWPARTARTKRKRRRNETDFLVTGERINRSSSPRPPILCFLLQFPTQLSAIDVPSHANQFPTIGLLRHFVPNSRHPDPWREWEGCPKGRLRDTVRFIRGMWGRVPKNQFYIASIVLEHPSSPQNDPRMSKRRLGSL